MAYPILYLHETAEMGGAEKSLLGLVLRLDPHRFKPYFVSGEEGPLTDLLKESGVPTRVLPLPRVRRLQVGAVLRTLRQIRQILREEKIALVHSNTPRTNFYGALSGRLEGKPVIWHARNLLSPFHERVDLDRLFSFLPDRIVCVSKIVQGRFRGLQKAVTVHNGVDLHEYRPEIDGRLLRDELGISASQIVVGMVGRIGPGKGHEEFLRALSQVVKQRRHILGVIVGKPFRDAQNQEAKLKTFAKELGLQDSLLFIGFRQDIPQVMAALDLFVLPTHAEPFSRSLLEAMSSGKAVIAARGGGVPEVVTDRQSGLLVSPRDPQEIAEAVLFLVDHPQERARLGREARLRIEGSFSFDAHVHALESLYLQLLGER